jgi:hypothetical protein
MLTLLPTCYTKNGRAKFKKDTSGIKRYIGFDIHKEYALVGGQNARQEWVMQPGRVGLEKFREWAQANLRPGDAAIIETTTNVWDVYDIVAPLVSYVVVAHAGGVRQIAEARVKTDKKDIECLLRLLIADIVPEVVGPAGACARVARNDLISQPAGQNEYDDS